MFDNQAILVTGASSGIGQMTAFECAKSGAFVYLAGRNENALQEMHEQLPNSQILVYDVTSELDVKNAFAKIAKADVPLYGMVNCAGQMLDAGLAMTRLSDVQQQLNVNTIAAFQHCQLASRLMSRHRQGSIVNVCSAVGEQGSVGQSAYATSKAALSGLTKSLARELGPLGLRVNAVAPGFIDTPLTESYQNEKRQSVVAQTSLKREGKAQEVADAIVFLLSSKASYISGQIIGIDGGLSI